MTPGDICLAAALAGFAVLFAARAGKACLLGAASAALLCGAISLHEGRWQALLGAALALVFLLLATRDVRGSAVRWRAGGLLFAVALGAMLPFWFFPVFRLPTPDGPYAVGSFAVEMTDDASPTAPGQAVGARRRLPVRIWHPAAPGAGGARAAYTGRPQALSLGRNFGQPWFYYAQLTSVRTNARPDAPVAPGRWPVVLLNHGLWSYVEQNSALAEHLASHGYVVVGVGHPGDSVAYRFADGTRVEPSRIKPDGDAATRALEEALAAFMGGRTEEERFRGLARSDAASAAHRLGRSAKVWRDDNLLVFRALKSGHVPARVRSVLSVADLSRVAVAGMSFGGSAAPSVCARLAECRAAVNLDGESFDFSFYNSDLRSPLLLVLTGQRFARSQLDDMSVNPTDYAYERWANVGRRQDIYRLRVASLRHLGLTDLLLSARAPFKARLYGAIDSRRGVALLNDAVLGFLDRHVTGRSNGFPEAIEARYPEITRQDPGHVRRWWLARNARGGCGAEPTREAASGDEAMRLGDWIARPLACAPASSDGYSPNGEAARPSCEAGRCARRP